MRPILPASRGMVRNDGGAHPFAICAVRAAATINDRSGQGATLCASPGSRAGHRVTFSVVMDQAQPAEEPP